MYGLCHLRSHPRRLEFILASMRFGFCRSGARSRAVLVRCAFSTFFAVTAAAGAAYISPTHAGEQFPMIGASAADLRHHGGRDAFCIPARGPLGLLGRADASSLSGTGYSACAALLSDARVAAVSRGLVQVSTSCSG
mgnify:CR=1 FL=1